MNSVPGEGGVPSSELLVFLLLGIEWSEARTY